MLMLKNPSYLLICCFLLTLTCSFTNQKSESIQEQPLPVKISGSRGTKNTLVVYFSGDGGWNSFSLKLMAAFEKEGYGVVAFNSRKYFWTKKTPEIFAKDATQLAAQYLKEWSKKTVVWVGYSFGADVAAFLPCRLPNEMLAKTERIILLSPSLSSDFVVRLTDLIGDSKNTKRKYKLGPEINGTTLPVVCIFGKKEDLLLKNSLIKKESLTILELPGGHQYNNDPASLVKLIGL
jgi:type IV secretory pathway VirJ component